MKRIKRVNELSDQYRGSEHDSMTPRVDKFLVQEIIDRMLEYGEEYLDELDKLNEKYPIKKDAFYDKRINP